MTLRALTARQTIPHSGPEREALREKGQFWTPDWVAEAMVGYATQDDPGHLFDPAVGAGVFFRAAKSIAAEFHSEIRFLGTELDPRELEKALYNGLSSDDLAHVELADFILDPPKGPFKAIVANPPYIRHHRLSISIKEELRRISASTIGVTLDGRAGLHVYFLIRALRLLDKQGRLAFIMPADTCEGIFASTLWNWIARNYRIDAVITFSPDASPFPKVDTNPVIFMISNEPPREEFSWARCLQPQTRALKSWVDSGFDRICVADLDIRKRSLVEGLSTGLSRPPTRFDAGSATLGDFASVLRGIATGANDFFFLTVNKAAELRIPDDLLIPAIGRTRDAPDDHITHETIERLDMKGRPTLLFSPDGRSKNDFTSSVREYLDYGEERGVHEKSLISTRRPWYKMETRMPPPILFAYLGRRNTRFIRNLAGVVPLTSFLCIYPHRDDQESVERLWQVLQHPQTIANLSLVGKSYGGGAIKVEPRSLERLPIPGEAASLLGSPLCPQTKQTKLWQEV